MVWDLDILKVGPKASLIDGYCNIWIEGERKPPGNYDVNEGDEVRYRGRVKNSGDTEGRIGIFLVDKKSGEIIDYKDDVLVPGGWLELGPDSFDITQDRDLEYQGRHKAGRTWKTDDTKGG